MTCPTEGDVRHHTDGSTCHDEHCALAHREPRGLAIVDELHQVPGPESPDDRMRVPDPGELKMEMHAGPPWAECHVCRRMRSIDGQTMSACQACGDAEYDLAKGIPWVFRARVEVSQRTQRKKGLRQVVELQLIPPRRRWTPQERQAHETSSTGYIRLHVHKADAFPPGAELMLVLVERPPQDTRAPKQRVVVVGDKLELVANVGSVDEHVAVGTVVSDGDEDEPGLRVSWRKPGPQSGALEFTYTHVRMGSSFASRDPWWCRLDPASNAGSFDPVLGGLTWSPEQNDLALSWPAGCMVATEGDPRAPRRLRPVQVGELLTLQAGEDSLEPCEVVSEGVQQDGDKQRVNWRSDMKGLQPTTTFTTVKDSHGWPCSLKHPDSDLLEDPLAGGYTWDNRQKPELALDWPTGHLVAVDPAPRGMRGH